MNTGATTFRPFRLPNRFSGPVRRALFAGASPAFEKAMAFDALNGIYQRVRAQNDPGHFAENALAALGVTFDIAEEELSQVPREGPLVVGANHPFGGLEGLVLLALLRRVRPDVRVMANYLLHRIPDLRDTMFFVDPFARPESASRNVASLRASIRWLRRGAGRISRRGGRAPEHALPGCVRPAVE